MKIRDMMNPNPIMVGPELRFGDLFCRYTNLIGAQLHVVDDGNMLLGVIASQDIMRRMLPAYLDTHLASLMVEDEMLVRKGFERNLDTTARDVMQTGVPTLMAKDPFIKAKAIMSETTSSAIPVVDEDERLVGEITCTHVLAYLSTHCLECACEMPKDLLGNGAGD